MHPLCTCNHPLQAVIWTFIKEFITFDGIKNVNSNFSFLLKNNLSVKIFSPIPKSIEIVWIIQCLVFPDFTICCSPFDQYILIFILSSIYILLRGHTYLILILQFTLWEINTSSKTVRQSFLLWFQIRTFILQINATTL